MIHLDTSFLIRALQAGTAEDRTLRRWLADRVELGTSVICWTEFLCGPLSADDIGAASTIVPEPEPFLAEDADMAAGLFNATGRRRGSLIDCMIAATAMRVDAALATSNIGDFQRFEAAGLRAIRP